MKTARVIVLALAALVGACSPSKVPAPGKMGAAPPPGRVVYSDPSVSPGVRGAVGEVVYLGDGTASWVKNGTGDTAWSTFPPAAGLSSVTTDTTLSGAGTLGSPLGANLAGLSSVYSTALLDLTATADNISMGVPQRTGYIFVPRLLTVLWHDGSGTATGSLVWSAGNNASHNNLAQMTVTSTTINANIAVEPQPSFANGGGTSAILDGATVAVAKITTGVTGVTSLHGYLSMLGFWVPL